MRQMTGLTPQTRATIPRDRRRGGGWRLLAIAAALLLLLYVVSPYYALWRFVGALKTGNTADLASRVDFMEVREAMKKQLRDRFFPKTPEEKAKKNRLNAIVSQLGPTLIDQLVDAYLTPDGLVALIQNPRINAISDRPAAVPSAGGTGLPNFSDTSKVRYAFFTGPADFLVDLNGTKLRFGFGAEGWRVHRVELNLDDATRRK